jgi:hypothetical protein
MPKVIAGDGMKILLASQTETFSMMPVWQNELHSRSVSSFWMSLPCCGYFPNRHLSSLSFGSAAGLLSARRGDVGEARPYRAIRYPIYPAPPEWLDEVAAELTNVDRYGLERLEPLSCSWLNDCEIELDADGSLDCEEADN